MAGRGLGAADADQILGLNFLGLLLAVAGG
jgi:hypothetical protein